MTNWDLITIANTIRNKDYEGEDIKASEWQSLFNANSAMLFSDLIGNRNEYQPNFPIARSGVGVSRKVSHALRPFLVTDTVAVSGGSLSTSALSATVGHLIAIDPATLSGRSFDEVEPDEWGDRVGSSVVSPSADDPVFKWTSKTSITLSPSTITQVSVTYYKKPADCVIATTTNSTTLLEEYNASGSTEFLWEDQEKLEILYRALREVGVNMERQDLYLHGNNITNNK